MTGVLFAVIAWLLAAACFAVVIAHGRRLDSLGFPSVPELVERVERAVPRETPHFEAHARSELDELLRDVDWRTSTFTRLSKALPRISLAGGTALAIATLALDVANWKPPLAAFMAGLAGAFGVAQVGRLANARARRMRQHWSNGVASAWARLAKG